MKTKEQKMNEQLITSKIQQINSENLKLELLAVVFRLKGTFKMADDFDESLDDFRVYLP